MTSDSEDHKEPTRLDYLNYEPTGANRDYGRELDDVGWTGLNEYRREEGRNKEYIHGIQHYRQEETIDRSSEETYENQRETNLRRDVVPRAIQNYTDSEDSSDKSDFLKQMEKKPTTFDLIVKVMSKTMYTIEGEQIYEVHKLITDLVPPEVMRDMDNFRNI